MGTRPVNLLEGVLDSFISVGDLDISLPSNYYFKILFSKITFFNLSSNSFVLSSSLDLSNSSIVECLAIGAF
jgi:hypothetical protein